MAADELGRGAVAGGREQQDDAHPTWRRSRPSSVRANRYLYETATAAGDNRRTASARSGENDFEIAIAKTLEREEEDLI